MKTEVVFILDRSGSMEGLEADTIGTKAIFSGISSFVSSFAAMPEVGNSWLKAIDEDYKQRR